MTFLRGVTDRFWNYVSPRKIQQRRDKPFKVPAIPVKAKVVVKEFEHLSPAALVEQWEVKTPGSASSVDRTLLPPSPPTSDEQYVELEGDTLLPDQTGESEKVDDVTYKTSDWDANEETIVVDDGEYYEEQKKINRAKERMRREQEGHELRNAGWTEDAVFLFQKLGMRGFEPLMPFDWVHDFESLPVDLFTRNEEKAFIKSDSGRDYRAQLALTELFELGGRVRDAVLTKAPVRTPAYHIRETVRKYYRWAMSDAGMQHIPKHLALYEVTACPAHQRVAIAEAKMIEKLAKLMRNWEDAFLDYNNEHSDRRNYTPAPELPTLYGVVASHTVMAFVSYVLPSESKPASLRMVAMFDFGQEGYDVWNSLAIAIFIIHCRNRMKQLRDFLPGSAVIHAQDPDL